MKEEIEQQGLSIAELYIDRQYVSSDAVADVIAQGGEVVCRPWRTGNGELFSKEDFNINVRDRMITCPLGQTEPASV